MLSLKQCFLKKDQDRQNNYNVQISYKGYILESNYCSPQTERMLWNDNANNFTFMILYCSFSVNILA